MTISDFVNFEFLIPTFSKKTIFFLKNLYKTNFVLNFQRTGIYFMKTSICYAHAKF